MSARSRPRRRWPWWAVAVLATGLLLRAALLVASEDRPLRVVDEQQYHRLAQNLFAGHGFCRDPGQPTSARPPLYPAFVGAVWRITGGESLQAVRAAQILLSLLNAFLLWRLGARIYDRRTGMLAAGAFWLYPSFIAFDFLLLSEVLFTLLLTLGALGYACLGKGERWWTAPVTGVVFGLAALTRSAIWPLPLLLGALAYLAGGEPRPRRLRRSALLLLGYVLVIAPWSARNTRVQEVFTLIDSSGGWSLLMGNYEHTPLDRPWDAIKRQGEESWAHPLFLEQPQARDWTEGRKQRWAVRRAVSFMLDNPGLTARRSLAKLADFWGLERAVIAGLPRDDPGSPRWWVLGAALAIVGSYAATALLAAVGLFLAPPDRRRDLLLLLLIVLQICAVHTLVFGHSRYHLPLIPLLLLWAAAALVRRSWRGWRQRPGLAGAALGTQAFLVLIWAREVLSRDADRIREFLGALP